jgi:hypothetical protein
MQTDSGIVSSARSKGDYQCLARTRHPLEKDTGKYKDDRVAPELMNYSDVFCMVRT